MALEVEWYDFVCFGIVGVAFLGSLWVLYQKEGGSRSSGSAEDALDRLLLGGQRKASRTDSHVGTDCLWTSCWKGMHPGWLLATRLVSFLAMAGFLSWDIADWNATVFLYYTEWTFALVMVYFGLGTIVSAHGCWVHSTRKSSSTENGTRNDLPGRDLEESIPITSNGCNGELGINGTKSSNGYGEEGFLRRAGFWGYLMQVTYQASAGAVVLTDVVFWCLIVPFLSIAHVKLNWVMGCMHTMNAIFLLTDTTLNSLPFPWFRISYFILWSCAYILFQWIIHACGFSWWPYPFIELNTPWAPVWYFALAVAHIPSYGIFTLIVKAKNVILTRLFPRAFVRMN